MPALPDPVAVLLTSPRDGRVGFLIPWEDRTLVGTTDDDWHGDPGALEVTDAEAEYLLEMANSHLADPWGRNDIEGRFAGVRVLRAAKGNSASATTREWQLDREGSVFTTTGGKLTSSRLEAANTVDAVLEHLGRTTIPCRTDRPLPRTAEEPETWMSRAASEAADLGLDRECARALCRRYGTAVSRIFDLIRATPNLATRIHGSLPYVLAEVRHAIRFEEALDLEDILRRRIPLAILTSLDHETVEPVARIAADELGWDETRISAEIGRLTV